MKTTIKLLPKRTSVCAIDTIAGRLYKDKRGNIFVRTYDTLCCLTEVGCSYSTGIPSNEYMEELAIGESITLTQE
jgi:hypothetical protein